MGRRHESTPCLPLYDAIASRNTDPMKGSADARKILTRRENTLRHSSSTRCLKTRLTMEFVARYGSFGSSHGISVAISLSPAGNNVPKRVVQVIRIQLRTDDFQIFRISHGRRKRKKLSMKATTLLKRFVFLAGISETNLKAWRLE